MVKTPYGIINMTSSSGGGTGPAGEGWERILLNSADTTADPYSRVASIDSETAGATGETTITLNLGDPGGLGAPARYLTNSAVYYYDISKDWTVPRLWEFFFEFSSFNLSTSDIIVYLGLSFNDTQASISNNTIAGGIWCSPRGAAGQNYAVRFQGTTHTSSGRTTVTANNFHFICQQPVGNLAYGHLISIQNDDYDLMTQEIAGRVTAYQPASNTDPVYLIVGFSTDMIGASGTRQESFRLWYRVTEDYFTWS